MLSEAEITSLVVKGENEDIDLKRELNLDLASEKAEFIKDVISIANSKLNIGYLLVGIANDGAFIGTNAIEEERIQQIIHSYIYPSLTISCYLVAFSTSSLCVGVIEIQGSKKPYMVLRPTDKLLQHEVFVRHGSVVAKASPQEVIRMYEETNSYHNVVALTYSAENFLKLGFIQNAIDEYSKAINVKPISNLLYLRSTAYFKLSYKIENQLCNSTVGSLSPEINSSFENVDLLRRLAIKDLSDCINLVDSFEDQIRFRLSRIYLLKHLNRYDLSFWDEDINWLKANAKGEKLGNTLFLEAIKSGDLENFNMSIEDALSLMDKVIELGYRDIDVYIERIKIHFAAMNYGIALKEVEKAFLLTNDSAKIDELLCLESWILTRTNQFEKFFKLAEEIVKNNSNSGKPLDGYVEGALDAEEEILCRYILDLEFRHLNKGEIEEAKKMVSLFKPYLSKIEVYNPGLANILHKYLDN